MSLALANGCRIFATSGQVFWGGYSGVDLAQGVLWLRLDAHCLPLPSLPPRPWETAVFGREKGAIEGPSFPMLLNSLD